MKKIAYLLLTISFCGLTACKTGTKKGGNMDNETLVKIETTLGDIKVKLYNETPKHRDNFIKLAEDGVYEGTLFHRVIKDFMIQAGDPDSKNAPKGKMLGAGDVGYTLPAEFVIRSIFTKKALCLLPVRETMLIRRIHSALRAFQEPAHTSLSATELHPTVSSHSAMLTEQGLIL